MASSPPPRAHGCDRGLPETQPRFRWACAPSCELWRAFRPCECPYRWATLRADRAAQPHPAAFPAPPMNPEGLASFPAPPAAASPRQEIERYRAPGEWPALVALLLLFY